MSFGRGVEKASVQVDNSKEAMREATKEINEKVKNLSNVQQLLHYLKVKDLGGMVGAVTAIFADYYGKKEEKKSEKNAREKPVESEQSTQASAKNMKSDLSELRKDVGSVKQPNPDVDSEREIVKKSSSIDRPGSEVVYIGASIMMGFAIKSKNSFIGKGGAQSERVLSILKENKGIFEGKKAVVIQGYGNDLAAGKKPSDIIPNMEEMVKLSKSSGISNVSIVLRLPYGSALSDPKRRERAIEMYEAIKEKWGNDDSVKIIDLYSGYVDLETGFVKEKYDSADPTHLWGKAYKDALIQIGEESGISSAQIV